VKKSWVFIIVAFAIGLFVGIFFGNRLLTIQAPGRGAIELHQRGFKFINPLLECDIGGEDMEFIELKPFKKDLQALVDSLKAKDWIDYGAVYFRDLNNGPWFGINEKEKFTPASLSKVPLMMAYYKEVETRPEALHRSIKFEGLQDENRYQNIRPSHGLEPGKMYSVEDLIRRMIVYSDNNAAMLLNKDVDQKTLVAVFTDLNVPLPIGSHNDIMTVKQYAAFFRILFNASYLSREMSEKALELLARTEFRDGIVGGIPPGVQVAHKFGERDYTGRNSKKQLHDCGIVYYPEHPYLICVMTRGESFERLDDSIREISAFVFKKVDEQLGKK
jgi:beta-lactamase class A